MIPLLHCVTAAVNIRTEQQRKTLTGVINFWWGWTATAAKTVFPAIDRSLLLHILKTKKYIPSPKLHRLLSTLPPPIPSECVVTQVSPAAQDSCPVLLFMVQQSEATTVVCSMAQSSCYPHTDDLLSLMYSIALHQALHHLLCCSKSQLSFPRCPPLFARRWALSHGSVLWELMRDMQPHHLARVSAHNFWSS